MQVELKHGLSSLDIDASVEQIQKLINFVELLLKWNKVFNLTSIRNSNDIINIHILDSLSLLPHLGNTKNLLDVGSGAGLPGIPLAIFQPQRNFVLLDGNGKKTRFINQVAIELGLKNVTAVHSRVEKYHPDDKFDCVTTRAFATIAETLDLIGHFIDNNTRLIFMKSNTAEEELTEIDNKYKKEIIKLSVPGIDAPRTLAVLTGQSLI